MIQETTIPIDMGMGVDTKTDPKLVVAGKFLRLENGVFTTAKRVTKRNGYTALSTTVTNGTAITAPKMVHGYNDELLAADNGKLLSYSSSRSAWMTKGPYVSTEVARSSIDQKTPSSGFVDCAVMGNYILYGWSTATHESPTIYSKVYGSVVDSQSGNVISRVLSSSTETSSVLLSTSTSDHAKQVRCVSLGGAALAIIYTNPSTGAIVSRLVTFGANGLVTFSNETTISTGYVGISFDVEATSTGAVIVYQNGTGVAVSTLDTTGAVVLTTTITDSNIVDCFAIKTSFSTGDIWVYWVDNSGISIAYAILSSALASVLTKTSILTGSAGEYIFNMIAIDQGAAAQTLYYGNTTTTGSGASSVDVTNTISVDDAGNVTNTSTFSYGIVPYSRAASLTAPSADSYAIFAYRGGTGDFSFSAEPTFFLVNLTSLPDNGIPYVAARFAAGIAGSDSVLQIRTTGDVARTSLSYTPSLATLSTNKVIFGCGIELQEFQVQSGSTFGPATTNLVGSFSYSFDFNGPNAYRANSADNLVLLNGGNLQMYDGSSVVELNYHLFPEIMEVVATASAGGGLAGAYDYIAIFQWTDFQGNLHQSTPSPVGTVTVGGGNNAATIYVRSAFLSQKNNVSVAIYRNVAGGGSVFYLVTDPVFLTSADPSVSDFAQFTDTLSDVDLIGKPLAYTYPASSVLENTTPPPVTIALSHNNRMWFVDAENPNDIWYTKSFQRAVGISPSGFLIQQIDPKYGDITALAEMDEKIVVFKTNGIFYLSGDGANDNGTNSTLSFPQIVPSDVGCSVLKSVITMPNGVMFKSNNGIYMLSRGTAVTYLGLEVEAYNSQVVTNATLVSGKTQVRFLCSTGLCLVYDYVFNQWSTFTNHTGYSATVWLGSYVYAKASGSVFQESSSAYTDNGTAYNLLAQTSWLALASVQGFQRVRRLIMLGDYADGLSASHGMQISAAYDFSTSFSTPVPFTFGAASSSGTFQYRERLPRQKCDTISLLIQESSTGDSAEYVDFTNMSFEAGIKKGVNKMPNAQTVG